MRAPDTFVKLALISSSGNEIARSKTSICRGQPNPHFKETFIFQVVILGVFFLFSNISTKSFLLGGFISIAWRDADDLCIQQEKYQTQRTGWLDLAGLQQQRGRRDVTLERHERQQRRAGGEVAHLARQLSQSLDLWPRSLHLPISISLALARVGPSCIATWLEQCLWLGKSPSFLLFLLYPNFFCITFFDCVLSQTFHCLFILFLLCFSFTQLYTFVYNLYCYNWYGYLQIVGLSHIDSFCMNVSTQNTIALNHSFRYFTTKRSFLCIS